jgi:hypothetical protein
MAALFTDAHQLNFDEAICRLEHWTQAEPTDQRAPIAVRTLVRALALHRDDLYFETECDREVRS